MSLELSEKRLENQIVSGRKLTTFYAYRLSTEIEIFVLLALLFLSGFFPSATRGSPRWLIEAPYELGGSVQREVIPPPVPHPPPNLLTSVSGAQTARRSQMQSLKSQSKNILFARESRFPHLV